MSSAELGMWESGPNGGWWGLSSQKHSPDPTPTITIIPCQPLTGTSCV